MYTFEKKSDNIFSEYNIVSYYTLLISSEIQNMYSFKNICHCKKQILEIKWNYWLRWWLSHSAYILRDDVKLSTLNKKAYIDNIVDTTNIIFDEINRSAFISNNMMRLFFEIHEIVMDEFTQIASDMLTDPKITKFDYLNKLGHLLHIICLNSIFEMVEINFSCDSFGEDTNRMSSYCDFNLTSASTGKPSIRLFVNKMYNINSYATKKIQKILNKISTGKNSFRVTLDFKFYKDSVTFKLQQAYKYIQDNFTEDVILENLPEIEISKMLGND